MILSRDSDIYIFNVLESPPHLYLHWKEGGRAIYCNGGDDWNGRLDFKETWNPLCVTLTLKVYNRASMRGQPSDKHHCRLIYNSKYLCRRMPLVFGNRSTSLLSTIPSSSVTIENNSWCHPSHERYFWHIFMQREEEFHINILLQAIFYLPYHMPPCIYSMENPENITKNFYRAFF